MADIVLDHLEKTYDNGYRAITDLNIAIEDGEFLVLVGPSGCGKSTALRMVAGLEDISGGELRIGGTRMNETAPRDRDIAMVFQSYALYPHLTVRENIAFGLKLRRTNKNIINQRVEDAAKTLGLTEYLDRKPRALSGGQRQRVAMGRAIVREPSAFLMDEPLSNLDAKLRGQMRAEIAKLQSELGVTTLYVTHDQVEAMTMGDRVAVLHKGILQQVDSPRNLYLEPDNLFVAGFMGSPPMNMAQATVGSDGEGGIWLSLGEQRLAVAPELVERKPALRSYVGRTVAVGVRPEDVTEVTAESPGPADRRLRATVELVEALGSEQVVHFDSRAPKVEAEEVALLERERTAGEQPAIAAANPWVAIFGPRSLVSLADTIELAVDTSQLYLFDVDTGLAIRT
jgi:multiple sugar transport system ATP-binding protein